MNKYRRFARSIAVFILGIIVPIFVLFQAYTGLTGLQTEISQANGLESAVALYGQAKRSIADSNNANDYALFSLLFSEQSNKSTIVNKQRLKVAIMQIGFAVVSVGMMFIVLGISDGGGEGGVDAAGLKFDFKTGSTGLITFVVGALMATAGGVLKNDYETVPIPSFIEFHDGVSAGRSENADRSIHAFKECSSLEKSLVADCFLNSLRNINKDAL